MVTTSGTSLSELGLGLGPTVNGLDCGDCNHRGYQIRFGHHYVVCETCDKYGLAYPVFPCRPCKGTGQFTQIRSRRVVNYRICKGSGKFENTKTHKRFCWRCGGSKTLTNPDPSKSHYDLCLTCMGTGEVQIYNPVLPKSALAQFSS